tara:strand:+ start:849 stop:1517 length:669 start_codon:yes stop_codon:yes gene_type:complete
MNMNVVLIPSIINTPNIPLSYSDVRSVFTRKERFLQLQTTIESIKKNIPNNYIVVVECTDLNKEETDYLSINIDLLVNVFKDEEVREIIYSASKSYGEGTMTLLGLKSLLKRKIEWDNLFKITGRYWLGEDFNFEKYNNSHNMIKCIDDDKENIYTCFYKLNKIAAIRWYYYLTKQEEEFKKNINFEIIFGKFIQKIHENKRFINKLGIFGNVATSGDLIQA